MCSTGTLTITGAAQPGASVKIYANGALATTVTANSVGFFSASYTYAGGTVALTADACFGAACSGQGTAVNLSPCSVPLTAGTLDGTVYDLSLGMGHPVSGVTVTLMISLPEWEVGTLAGELVRREQSKGNRSLRDLPFHQRSAGEVLRPGGRLASLPELPQHLCDDLEWQVRALINRTLCCPSEQRGAEDRVGRQRAEPGKHHHSKRHCRRMGYSCGWDGQAVGAGGAGRKPIGAYPEQRRPGGWRAAEAGTAVYFIPAGLTATLSP